MGAYNFRLSSTGEQVTADIYRDSNSRLGDTWVLSNGTVWWSFWDTPRPVRVLVVGVAEPPPQTEGRIPPPELEVHGRVVPKAVGVEGVRV